MSALHLCLIYRLLLGNTAALVSQLSVTLYLHVVDLKHFHNVEARFHCPQTILSLGFQCRDDFCELNRFGIESSMYTSELCLMCGLLLGNTAALVSKCQSFLPARDRSCTHLSCVSYVGCWATQQLWHQTVSHSYLHVIDHLHIMRPSIDRVHIMRAVCNWKMCPSCIHVRCASCAGCCWATQQLWYQIVSPSWNETNEEKIVQAAAGAHDHEDINMDNYGKSSGLDKNAQPQIAGNLAPPSESKAANGESDTVCLPDGC